MNATSQKLPSVIGSGSGPLPITVPINEACRLTGIGRSKLYELISAGQIDVIKVGTSTLIPTDSLIAFLEERRA